MRAGWKVLSNMQEIARTKIGVYWSAIMSTRSLSAPNLLNMLMSLSIRNFVLGKCWSHSLVWCITSKQKKKSDQHLTRTHEKKEERDQKVTAARIYRRREPLGFESSIMTTHAEW